VNFILDTNIISALRSSMPDENLLDWFERTHDRHLFTSVMVIGELRKGIHLKRRRDPVAADKLESWFGRVYRYVDRKILPVTEEIAEEWATLSVPDPMPVVDGLIAATGLVHNYTVVTRNVRDFERTGVKLLNPFDPRLPAPGPAPHRRSPPPT